MVYISAMVLRKRLPNEAYKFKIRGGYPFLVLLCVIPIIIAVASFFVNGTDYFIGGLLGILTGPVVYVWWKRRYGGLAKKDPVHYPLNPRTRLGVGDLRKIAWVFFGSRSRASGYPVAEVVRGDWRMIYTGIGDSYLSGWLGNFDAMLTTILSSRRVLPCIGCAIAAFKLEPRKGQFAAGGRWKA